MSTTSAEVAADFKDALNDLKVNSRPEISNLTIIAKENTEHAQAISRELENHIRTVSRPPVVQVKHGLAYDFFVLTRSFCRHGGLKLTRADPTGI